MIFLRNRLLNDGQIKCLFACIAKACILKFIDLFQECISQQSPSYAKSYDIRKLAMMRQNFVKSEGNLGGYDVRFFHFLYFQEGIKYYNEGRSFVAEN